MNFFRNLFKTRKQDNTNEMSINTSNPAYEELQKEFSLILPAIIGLLKFNVDGGFIVLKINGGCVNFIASASDYSANMVSLSGGWYKHLLGIRSFIGTPDEADILSLTKLIQFSFEDGDAYFRYTYSGKHSNNNLYRTWLINYIKTHYPDLSLKLTNNSIEIIV